MNAPMTIQLFIKYEDIERYNNGEEIIATDQSGKSAIFKHGDNVQSANVPSTEIIGREDVVTNGFVKGTFNKFTVRRLP
jgi:hypothetical protein